MIWYGMDEEIVSLILCVAVVYFDYIGDSGFFSAFFETDFHKLEYHAA